ncbi:GNAT family N-acetyltransferase [Methanobrevibacter sp. OttesenSCG-928-K11]|nr:GNAT family N-acetyltransferase [Methanobrevibacter sp. OttesenSCG-928-K11]
MIFKDFDINFDLDKIATLKYDVDFRTYHLVFKNKNKAIQTIKKDLSSDEPSFSDVSNLKIIFDENSNIIGFINFINKKEKIKFKTIFKLFKNVGFLNGFRLGIVSFLDSFVLADFKNRDIYLAEIAIDSSKRGKGFGTKVLNKFIQESKNKKEYKRITLDVDVRNENVKALYEKLGFKVFNKKNFKIFSFERGMYNMEFILDE